MFGACYELTTVFYLCGPIMDRSTLKLCRACALAASAWWPNA